MLVDWATQSTTCKANLTLKDTSKPPVELMVAPKVSSFTYTTDIIFCGACGKQHIGVRFKAVKQ